MSTAVSGPAEALPAVSLDAATTVLDLNAATADGAIRELGATLVRAGCVEAGWVTAAVERERSQPTGLPTEPIGVAIPHADPDLVIRPSIAIGRTRTAVRFREMASDDRFVDARLLFMPALDSKRQALVLSDLIAAFQREGFLAALLAAATPADAVRIVRETMTPG